MYREELIESIADFDDDLAEKYLGGEEIDNKTLISAIRNAVIHHSFIPVFCGTAFKNKGVQPLLDAIVDYMPSPIDVGDIKGHDGKDVDKTITRKPDPSDDFSGLAFKIATDPFVGQLTYFRIYSGELKAGSQVFNPLEGKKKELEKFFRCMQISEKSFKSQALVTSSP